MRSCFCNSRQCWLCLAREVEAALRSLRTLNSVLMNSSSSILQVSNKLTRQRGSSSSTSCRSLAIGIFRNQAAHKSQSMKLVVIMQATCLQFERLQLQSKMTYCAGKVQSHEGERRYAIRFVDVILDITNLFSAIGRNLAQWRVDAHSYRSVD
jgi:hypothetical protein